MAPLGALFVVAVGAWIFLQTTMGELVERIQSYLPGSKEPDNAGPTGSVQAIGGKQRRRKFLELLRRQLGQEYEWGGETRKTGFDCSGLIYNAMNKLGYADFPRTSAEQIEHAKKLSFPRAYLLGGAVVYQQGHIAVSAGNGRHTLEARGEGIGVVRAEIKGRGWTRAGIFPELT